MTGITRSLHRAMDKVARLIYNADAEPEAGDEQWEDLSPTFKANFRLHYRQIGKLVEQYESKLSAIQELHKKSPFPASRGEGRGKEYCLQCTTSVDHHVLYVFWPCPTIAIVQKATEIQDSSYD